MAKMMRGLYVKKIHTVYGPLMLLPHRMMSGGCKGPMKPNVCGSKKESEFEGQALKKPLVSMWENPFCDKSKGPCPSPRFDDLYYCESDKAKRLYWQTWADCPKLVIKPKKVCVNIQTAIPRRRRKRKIIKYKRTECKPISRCPLIPNKCHKKARCPTTCFGPGAPTGCKKPMAPYPSFSECMRNKPRKRPARECDCLRKPILCEIWAEWRKRETNQTV